MSALALVIEDDEHLATIFSAALRDAGFETDIIRDGAVAFTRLNNIVPDVVVLDVNLPLIRGPQILERIRSDKRLEHTRVILATADAAAAEGEMRDKADLILIKPIRFSQMRDLAARLLPHDAADSSAAA
jgi:DNA-binding response OmpR family regulator